MIPAQIKGYLKYSGQVTVRGSLISTKTELLLNRLTITSDSGEDLVNSSPFADADNEWCEIDRVLDVYNPAEHFCSVLFVKEFKRCELLE